MGGGGVVGGSPPFHVFLTFYNFSIHSIREDINIITTFFKNLM